MFERFRLLPLFVSAAALAFAAFVAIGGEPPDQDGDGVPDLQDNCLIVPNGPLLGTESCVAQEDGDRDGYGNICDRDVDNDGGHSLIDLSIVLNAAIVVSTDPNLDHDCDGGVTLLDVASSLLYASWIVTPGPSGLDCAGTIPCPPELGEVSSAGGLPLDTDGDGVEDSNDNCVTVPNGPLLATNFCGAQEDGDQDGYGSPCDTDLDNDGGTTLIDVSIILEASRIVSTDPAYDFDCDGGVGLIDVSRVLTDSTNVAAAGPSGLACAGTIPCP